MTTHIPLLHITLGPDLSLIAKRQVAEVIVPRFTRVGKLGQRQIEWCRKNLPIGRKPLVMGESTRRKTKLSAQVVKLVSGAN